jgi:putative spermidine/putrescine transport system ATP-binding protein
VFVTHDQEEALAVSDRIAVMNAGTIEQIGTPEDLYLRPATAGVAAFVGVSSLVPGVVAGSAVTVWGIELPLQTAAHDGHVDVFVRPENVLLVGADQPGANGVVQESTFLGSFRRTLVRTDDGTLVAVQHRASDKVEYGDVLRVGIAPEPVAVRAA